ncbi:MAG TPA: AzlC family ABC transporter permease [Candidatus Limnocylindrales bacterium]
MSAQPTPLPSTGPDLAAARRRLLLDTFGIGVSVAAFGLVFGLAARSAGFSPIEAVASSVLVFAGASQFAAAGYIAAGLPWAPIVVLTFFLNARHILYSASLAPRLRRLPLAERALMSHVLTDEAFALSAGHFHRLGRLDIPGYWIAAVLGVFIPWNIATLVGVLLGGTIPDPSRFGLDIVFPAAMAGLAVGLVTGRREAVAAGAGAIIGTGMSLLIGPALGIIVGGLLGPLLGMATPVPPEVKGLPPDSEMAGRPVDIGAAELESRADEASLGPQAADGR